MYTNIIPLKWVGCDMYNSYKLAIGMFISVSTYTTHVTNSRNSPCAE